MNARKQRDPFTATPKLNKQRVPIVASMRGNQPRILQLLLQHRTLTRRQLWKLLGGDWRSTCHTVDVLQSLPNEMIRPVAEDVRIHSRARAIHLELAPNGVDWLNTNGYRAHQADRIYNLDHAHLVSEIMTSLVVGIEREEGAEFVTWETLQDHPKFPRTTIDEDDNTAIPHPNNGHTIRPDTHPFGLEVMKDGRKHYAFLVLEADNSTESIKKRIREKLEAYKDFIDRKRFHARYGFPNYFVLFVFKNPTRMLNAMSELGEMGGSRFILFQSINPDGAPGYIFTTPCERAGFPPLQLNQP